MDRKFEIGPWHINPELGEIQQGQHTARVEPKVMDVLLCLSARSGSVVSKDTLITSVWPDTHVAEAALTSAIWKLRQAFDDDPKQPRVIQTVPRRGYRLLPPVHSAPAPGGDDPPIRRSALLKTRAAGRRWSGGLLLLPLGLLLGIVIGFELGVASAPAASDVRPIESVALMPLQVRSGNGQLAVLGDGIVHGASTRLSQLSELKVVSGAPTRRFSEEPLDATRVARDLRVRGVLTGFVTSVGDEIVVYVELLDGRDNSNLWGKRFRRRRSDVLRLEEEFSIDIATALGLRLTREEASSITRRYTDNPSAYNVFQLARFSCQYKQVSRDECVDLYQQALELDPGYALPYAGLAAVYFQTDAERPDVAMPLAEQYARRAVELAPDLAEAHLLLAKIQLYYHWDWEEARRGLDEAQRVNPNGVDIYSAYADFLHHQGQTDAALQMIDQARTVDPLATFKQVIQARILNTAGRFSESIELLEGLLTESESGAECAPTLAEAYLRTGRRAEAVDLYRTLVTREDQPLAISCGAGYVFALGGDDEGARQQLDRLLEARSLGYIPASWIAGVLVGLDRKEEALGWLETAHRERDPYLVFLKTARMWDPLRSDPRFQTIYGDLGFPSD